MTDLELHGPFPGGVSANAVPAAYTSGSGVLDQRVSLPGCLFGDRGEGISDILPSPGSEWATELRRQRSQVAQLPRPFRLILKGARSAHLLGLLLDEVHSELHRRAAVAGHLLHTIPETADDPVELFVIEALHVARTFVPRLDAVRLLGEMSRDRQFLRRLRKAVRQAMRQSLWETVWAGEPSRGDLPSFMLFADQVNRLPARVGIVARRIPYSAPEAVWLFVARLVLSREKRLRVLHVGALNSPLAWALVGVDSSLVVEAPDFDDRDAGLLTFERQGLGPIRVQVTEVEVLGGPTPCPLVVYRGREVPSGQFELVVVEIPPPSEGKGSHRLRHSPEAQEGAGTGRGDIGLDLGRLGPKRWLQCLPGYLRPALATGQKDVVVLVPGFTVRNEVQGPRISSDDRVSAVKELLAVAGFADAREYQVLVDERPSEPWTLLWVGKGVAQ
jgi:hypothetical protein